MLRAGSGSCQAPALRTQSLSRGEAAAWGHLWPCPEIPLGTCGLPVKQTGQFPSAAMTLFCFQDHPAVTAVLSTERKDLTECDHPSSLLTSLPHLLRSLQTQVSVPQTGCSGGAGVRGIPTVPPPPPGPAAVPRAGPGTGTWAQEGPTKPRGGSIPGQVSPRELKSFNDNRAGEPGRGVAWLRWRQHRWGPCSSFLAGSRPPWRHPQQRLRGLY